MATISNTVTNLVDSAIGPLSVTESTVDNFDIDDFVHSVTRAQCLQLQMINAIQVVDTNFTSNRPPLNLGGYNVGGFKNGS